MPGLQYVGLMFYDNSVYLIHFVCPETNGLRKLYGLKPKFCRAIIPIDVYVCRLIGLVTKEVKSVGSYSQYCRHRFCQ
jgi:hypothetical protein